MRAYRCERTKKCHPREHTCMHMKSCTEPNIHPHMPQPFDYTRPSILFPPSSLPRPLLPHSPGSLPPKLTTLKTTANTKWPSSSRVINAPALRSVRVCELLLATSHRTLHFSLRSSRKALGATHVLHQHCVLSRLEARQTLRTEKNGHVLLVNVTACVRLV